MVEDATLPAFSPDGRRVAVARTRSYRGGIGVVPAEGGEVRWLTSTGTWPTWMPDGSLIASDSVSSRTTLWLAAYD